MVRFDVCKSGCQKFVNEMMGAPSLLFKLRNLGVQKQLFSELALRCANEFKASMSAPTLISVRHKHLCVVNCAITVVNARAPARSAVK